ncbi:hypothetical protein PsorP6_017117 [Peronosclerospora sorghi]|uniref:Uncharacterized protein n=1 Tax=Peronosclerospora sorghi TaxID=230839 RepID=A0ACC0WDI7_9STRA|nr:hypothetical protein PsorP6_017117 [Peronosclerospora sorghi]
MEMKHDDLAGTGVSVPPEVNAMTTLARRAEMMATQQHNQMAQFLQHQRVVLDKLSSGRSIVEKRVEGISMTTYHGRVGEPLQVFLQQVKYFSAKNIDVQDSTCTNMYLLRFKSYEQSGANFSPKQLPTGTFVQSCSKRRCVDQLRESSMSVRI